MGMGFVQSVRQYIAERQLMTADGLYVVALSGGPDSVALLRVLSALGYDVHAAHCNFHLRGAESDRDEAFCRHLCDGLHVPLHIVHFDTLGYAALHKESVEMAARELRYHWFARLVNDIGGKAVCVAHHRDDQVETVLLNIIRGTGLRGLLGMQPKTVLPPLPSQGGGSPSSQEGTVVLRPMLGMTEAQVMEYLEAIGQDFVIDSTNLQDEAQRNKLRLDIIPRLEKINPAVKANIIRMTENLADAEAIVGESIGKAVADARISEPTASITWYAPVDTFDFAKVMAFPAPLTLLWAIMEPYGFNRVQAGEVAGCMADHKEWMTDRFTALLSHGRLYIVDRRLWDKPLPELRMPEPGLYRYVGRRVRVAVKSTGEHFAISKDRFRISIDADRVVFPLVLRPAAPGDRLAPYGMRGGKLVSDYLKDRKRDIIARHGQLVMADGSGRVVWLVGETIDNRCKVTDDTTVAMTVEIEP